MSCSCVSNITGVVIEKKREKERRITVYANAENGCIRTHAFWARLQKKNSTDTETIAVSYDMSKQIEHFQFRLTRARLVTKHATCRQNRQLVAETGDSVDEV